MLPPHCTRWSNAAVTLSSFSARITNCPLLTAANKSPASRSFPIPSRRITSASCCSAIARASSLEAQSAPISRCTTSPLPCGRMYSVVSSTETMTFDCVAAICAASDAIVVVTPLPLPPVTRSSPRPFFTSSVISSGNKSFSGIGTPAGCSLTDMASLPCCLYMDTRRRNASENE